MSTITSLSPVNYNTKNTQYHPAFKAAVPTALSAAVTKPSAISKFTASIAKLAKKTKNGYDSFIDKSAKKFMAPIINKIATGTLADKTAKMEGITDHMATLGSVVTTATYAGTTLANKNLEKKPARTLALNQFLVMILSTIGAYTINDKIANATKQLSYRFYDANQHLDPVLLSKRMKGFKAAQKLMTFTLMYRYVSPVIVTPVASKISKALSNRNPAPETNKTQDTTKAKA